MEHKVTNNGKPIDSNIFKFETGFDIYMLNDDLIVNGDCNKLEAQKTLENHQNKLEKSIQDKQNAKNALLEKLGITEEEAALLAQSL